MNTMDNNLKQVSVRVSIFPNGHLTIILQHIETLIKPFNLVSIESIGHQRPTKRFDFNKRSGVQIRFLHWGIIDQNLPKFAISRVWRCDFPIK